jgi:RHS repeat-associated protein
VEEQTGTPLATRTLYAFNGAVIAERNSAGSSLVYLHGDHLGSVTAATNASGGVASRQEFDPWGAARAGGGVSQTSLNFTGQRKDDTGLLYYHARYYDPALARFVSADSIVPSAEAGRGGAALAVDYHEPRSIADLHDVLDTPRSARGSNGPSNAQNFNRYSYVLGNPVRNVDPSGHICAEAGMGCGETSDQTYEGQFSGPDSADYYALAAMGATVIIDRELGLVARVDSIPPGGIYPDGGFEIHVYRQWADRSATEVGIWQPISGWQAKHEVLGEPERWSRNAWNRLNGVIVDNLRRRGLLAPSGEAMIKYRNGVPGYPQQPPPPAGRAQGPSEGGALRSGPFGSGASSGGGGAPGAGSLRELEE